MEIDKIQNDNFRDSGDWWQAVNEITDLMVCEGVEVWDENYICSQLTGKGFDPLVIDRALNWLQEASVSSPSSDLIGSIHEHGRTRIRVENPGETAFFSNDLWKRLEVLRLKGVISLDILEKLLAKLRDLDTRDWEEDEVRRFVNQVVCQASDYSVFPEELSDLSIEDRPYC